MKTNITHTELDELLEGLLEDFGIEKVLGFLEYWKEDHWGFQYMLDCLNQDEVRMNEEIK